MVSCGDGILVECCMGHVCSACLLISMHAPCCLLCRAGVAGMCAVMDGVGRPVVTITIEACSTEGSCSRLRPISVVP